jgi:hypothetical protein
MKVPSSKFQVPKTFAIPGSRENGLLFWDLNLGTSLELGTWNLELGT